MSIPLVTEKSITLKICAWEGLLMNISQTEGSTNYMILNSPGWMLLNIKDCENQDVAVPFPL